MFCTQCGTKLDDVARFCTLCGKPTAQAPTPSPGVGYSEAATGAPPFAASGPEFSSGPFPGCPAGAAFPDAGSYQGLGAGAPNAAPPKRLRRILAEKKISGVCAGFAEFFDIDVTLMRIIWVGLLLLPPHIGAIAYIVCIFVLSKT